MRRTLNGLFKSRLSRFLLFLLFAQIASLIAFGRILGPTVHENRVEAVQLLTELLYADSIANGYSDTLSMKRLARFSQFSAVNAWEVDGKGRVLVSTWDKPLPMEWHKMGLPAEGGDIEYAGSETGGHVYVTKLLQNQSRYVVYLFSHAGPLITVIGRAIFLLAMWFCVLAGLGAFLFFGREERAFWR